MTELFIPLSVDSQQAQPLLDGLFDEYYQIYAHYFDERGILDEHVQKSENDRSEPATSYLPPNGLFITLQRNNEIIAMGAYKRFDSETAELKRIWTHKDLRKQGLAAKMVKELERQAKLAGYKKVYLTTGFKQISAVKLYLSLGYQPQFKLNPNFDFEQYFAHPFKGDLPFSKVLSEGEHHE